MHAPRFSCWLIGADSLLMECGDVLRRDGHEIRGVVTSSSRIVDWAHSHRIPSVDSAGDFGAELAVQPFDYLFAITHLAFLPDRILRLPGRVAVNFHDGPLPDYAGLNAPAWALLNGETRYGVTWHVITPAIDAGEILKQRFFAVSPDETAVSLNTKCFEAGIESFAELVAELAHETHQGVPQDARRRRVFERYRRPPAACAIDWSRSAQEIEALVRALDFGRYPNPLGVPKIHRGDVVLAVTRAARVDSSGNGIGAARVPGTVLAVDDESVLVATGDDPIALLGFSDLRGRTLEPSEASRRLDLVAGAALDSLTPERAKRLTELDQRISRSERSWVRRLSELDPITLPFPLDRPVDGARARTAELRVSVPNELCDRFPGHTLPEVLLAALCGFLARLARRRSFDLGYRDLALQREAAGWEAWIASRVPLRVEVDPEEDLTFLLERSSAEISDVHRRGPWSWDAIARHPELRGLREREEKGESRVLPVCFECREDFGALALPPGAEWMLEVSSAGECRTVFDASRLSAVHAESIQRGFSELLASLASHPELPIGAHPIVCARERERQIEEWNRTELPHRRDVCIHRLIEEQARKTPHAIAVVCEGHSLTYAELDTRADLLAAELASLGVRAGDLIGIHVERSFDLVVAMLGTLKAGAAYLPLDPLFPPERLSFMVEDAKVGVIVTQEGLASSLPRHRAKVVRIDSDWPRIAARRHERVSAAVGPTDLAYVIYTSGSTGRPKGVLVEHRNVASFFAAMDRCVPHDPPGTWLALTSLSFDISVLELLWTLARGFKVVLSSGQERAPSRATPATRRTEFSLFYFSSDEGDDRGDVYRLLLEGAKFADANGFRAVWTPERHFHAFGGSFPNPAVTSAAIAAITRRVEIRAGSVVMPLHHPIRVAEEWAVVDNLSGGRVAISFASGWKPDDFVLAPRNHEGAKDVMFRELEVVRRLWRGESVAFPGPDGTAVEVRTLPRPVQPELPVWITSAGNVETYTAAGRIGANVLTHLLGQSVEVLARKIEAYREARREAGFDPATGVVTLMLHTFVGEDEEAVREAVREPLERYLASSLSLLKDHAWDFPAFSRPNGAASAKNGGDVLANLDPEERAALLAHARERYYESSGLFGTPERCAAMVERLQAIGVDEIACLIDFGVPADQVLASLPLLDRVRRRAQEPGATDTAPLDVSLSSEIRKESVTHIQCTPSMVRVLCSDPETKQALRGVEHVFVGGEALPVDLAAELAAATGGALSNMYGPTETTIWSSVHPLAGVPRAVTSGDASLGAPSTAASAAASRMQPVGTVPIGRPIAHTRVYVLDEGLQPLPIGAAGELFIGGDGVARGYLRRPELDTERFLADPFTAAAGARMYRTGDLARYRADGVLEFLGRTDHQIKVRGHRIEPGEIETLLEREAAVGEAVVVAREDTPGDQRLLAYIVPRGTACDPAGLRDRLRAELPEYMVPAQFVFLERIPRTPNGKVDRSALPTPEAWARPTAPRVPPSNDLEARLAELWQETLGLDQVGVDDNFFDIGGHSLLVVRMHRRMGELSTRPVSLTDLFRFPTIRSLARALTSDGRHDPLEEASLRGRRRRTSLQRLRRSTVEG